MSSPPSKNIPLFISENQNYKLRRLIPEEGASAVVTERWDGMRWTLWRGESSPDENAQGVRRSRVVLTPRCWRQACGKCPAGDGDNKPAPPGRARSKP